RCLQNSGRALRVRDTWSQRAEEVPSLSYAFDLHCVTAVAHAADLEKCNVRVLQEFFNDSFRFGSVCDLGIDHIVLGIVGANHTILPKFFRILIRCRVALAWFSVNKDWSGFRIGMSRRNRRKRK